MTANILSTPCLFSLKVITLLLTADIVPGAQNKKITVSTCAPQTDVDVSIEVRQSCTGARCVADAATANGCPENGLATSVTWQSYAGNSYLLHVSAPVSGTFGLKAIYTNSATTPTSPPVRQPITTEAIVPCDTLFGVDDGVEMKQEFFFGLFCINVCVSAPLAEFVLIFPFSLLGFSYGRCV